jgi:multidrug efflux pump subunit AcrB
MPGAEPGVIEALISTPIEDQIKAISSIDFYSSASLRGVSVVTLSVHDTVADELIEQVWIELREAVARARAAFPDGALAPQIDTDGVAAYSTVIAVEILDPGLSPIIATRFAEALEARIRAISQTRVVRLFGLPEEEILVSVDPFASSGDGLSVAEIATAIRRVNDTALAGRYQSDGLDSTLELSGRLGQVDDLRAIPLRAIPLRGSGTDTVLRLGDVAEIAHHVRSPAAALARANGHPAILIAAVVEDGAQADRWMALVHQEIAAMRQTLPRGLGVSVLFDQSGYTLERLAEVGRSMVFGMGIVAAVLAVTLGWQAAAIVGLILPVVSLATLVTFRFLDMPLQQMSIAGLIVALGLVVDSAIVTTDTVRRRLSAGEGRAQAATEAARRLFLPLAASTVTTILTFLPMILLPGNTGDFVSTIAIAVSVMLFWSFLLALILTAPLAAHLLPAFSRPAPIAQARQARFAAGVQFFIANPRTSICAALVLPLMGFASVVFLTPQFFPLVERNQFHITLELPAHASLRRTDDLVRRIDTYLHGLEGVESSYWVSGGAAPAFYYNIASPRRNEPAYAQGMITTDTPAATRAILASLQQDLTTRFPEARVIVQALVQGPPVGAPVELRIFGPELEDLRRIGAAVETAIAALPQTAQVRAGLTGGTPQLRYQMDSATLNLLGLTEGAIAGQLQAGLSGLEAGALTDGTRQIPIRVQFAASVLGNSDAINDLPILTALPRSAADDLATLPLSALAVPRLDITQALILRMRGERMNFVQAYPQPDILPEALLRDALAAISAANITLPEGYRLEIGGESDERNATVNGLLASLALIVALSLGALVLTFRSFRLTLGTVIVAGLSAGLSLLSVALMGFPLGINALIGVIGSIGVSVNATIIIFTALQGNLRAAAGDLDAILAEVMDGARHIFSTTLTTFGGFLPLLFSGGLFWPPFAAAVAGGVLLSGTLAFLFAPAYFRLVYCRSGLVLRLPRPAETAPNRNAPPLLGRPLPCVARHRQAPQGRAAVQPDVEDKLKQAFRAADP